ncbi:uncharacterized protein LOC115763793 [Drosophila novamexicana]|uniref:uncharacterized protein LOC115763793 n=1 Tax=Drosophila novamexicana TaxID=47314 RepID=UPI0011E604E6|nr:uncharacterized protein LOC115763793 [Drosophila novamexicana]
MRCEKYEKENDSSRRGQAKGKTYKLSYTHSKKKKKKNNNNNNEDEVNGGRQQRPQRFEVKLQNIQREHPEQTQKTSAACETAAPNGGLTHTRTHTHASSRYKNKHKDKRQKETCEKQKHENKQHKKEPEASDAQSN